MKNSSRPSSQAGFAVTGIILGFIAVLLVVILFYVYHGHNNGDTTATVPVNSSTTRPPSTKTNTPKNYVNITEWGIKLPVDSSVKDVSYSVAFDPSSAAIVTKSYTDAAKACLPPGGVAPAVLPVIIISKHAGTYTEKSMSDGAFDTFAKQFNDFYLTTSVADGGICPSGTEAQRSTATQIFNAQEPKLIEAVKNAQTL